MQNFSHLTRFEKKEEETDKVLLSKRNRIMKDRLTAIGLTWASAKQMRLIAEVTDEVASGGLSADIAECKEGRTS